MESLNKEQNATPLIIISCSFQKGAVTILCDCIHYFRENADEMVTANLFSIDLSTSYGTTHKHAYGTYPVYERAIYVFVHSTFHVVRLTSVRK